MFRPAMNTSRRHPLLAQHFTAGVLGQFTGNLQDAGAVCKWVKSFSDDWAERVVNASRTVSIQTNK